MCLEIITNIYCSPRSRRFRSKFEVRKYLDENHLEGVSAEMFDFALGSKKRRSIIPKSKITVDIEKPALDETEEVTQLKPENFEVKEEGKMYI